MKTTPVYRPLKTPTETDTQYQAIDQCQDCFNACLKAKKTTLNICYDVFLFNFMTFKAYVAAVMNKLTFVSFDEVGREQPLGEVGNSIAVLLQIYFSICVPKIIEICGLTKLLQK